MTWQIGTKAYFGGEVSPREPCIFHGDCSREGVCMKTLADPSLCPGSAINTPFGQVPAHLRASVSSSVREECPLFLEEGLMKLRNMNVSGPLTTLLTREEMHGITFPVSFMRTGTVSIFFCSVSQHLAQAWCRVDDYSVISE